MRQKFRYDFAQIVRPWLYFATSFARKADLLAPARSICLLTKGAERSLPVCRQTFRIYYPMFEQDQSVRLASSLNCLSTRTMFVMIRYGQGAKDLRSDNIASFFKLMETIRRSQGRT